MRYPDPLVAGSMVRRYKRFLADIELASGEVVVAHCPNPGSMRSCLAPGAPCRLSPSRNPKRKLAWTLEQIQVDGTWIMVNPVLANTVVAEAIAAGHVPELVGYPVLRREVRFGSRNSRVDMQLSGERGTAWVEVKSATLLEDGVAMFPDAVTARGTKHLRELIDVVADGDRGVLFFSVARADAALLRPARHIDPTYADTLEQALAAGVEVLAYRCDVSEGELVLGERMAFSV